MSYEKMCKKKWSYDEEEKIFDQVKKVENVECVGWWRLF